MYSKKRLSQFLLIVVMDLHGPKLVIVLVGSDVESPAQELDSRIGTSSQIAVSRIAE